VDWSTNLGEHARQILVMRFSRALPPNKAEIVVIGEQSIFCLKENGAIKTMKRVGEQMQCAVAFPVLGVGGDQPNEQAENLMVGTMSGHLQVYKETQLIWCARLHHVPVQIEVATIAGIMGMITTLDEKGLLQVSYLGTDAPTAALMNTESKELDYPAMEEEHQGLLRVIRQAHGEGAKEEEAYLTIMAKVPKDLELVPDEDAGPEVARVDGGVVQMTVQTYLHVTNVSEVENVTLVVRTPQCFVLPEKAIFLPRIQNGSPLTLPITFRVSTQHISTRLEVMLAACYSVRGGTGAGETRTATCKFSLPFFLLGRVIPPVKAAAFKISLDATKMPSSLTDLFKSFLKQPHCNPQIAQSIKTTMSIQYFAGGEATVQFAQQMGRFWVQSSEFAALWPLANEVCQKFSEFLSEENSDPQVLSYQDSLPLHDYFSLMDDHFGLRKHLYDLADELRDRTRQFRIIQKRLLVRFRDRNPTVVDSLESLLRMSFDQVNQIADNIDEAQRTLVVVSSHLSAATELIILLIKYRFDMDESNTEVLRNHFCSVVEDSQEQGWEEQTDAALQNLLKTSLARNAKERNMIVGQMKMQHDTTRLKKRITNVIDRLAGGARLADGGEVESDAELDEGAEEDPDDMDD
jgi:Bardet-Biedl syndrome 9 protein